MQDIKNICGLEMTEHTQNPNARAGYTKQSLARLAAVQAVFEMHQIKAEITKVIAQYLEHGPVLEDHLPVKFEKTLFQTLVNNTWEHQDYFNTLITDHLAQNWRLERLDGVLKTILQVALCELCFFKDIDQPVIISEYVRLTDAFLEQKQAAFVNKILDVMGKKIKNTDKVF